MPTYRVTGPFPFGEHALESTFEAETDERIERAMKRGSISPEETPPTLAETPNAPASTTSTDTSPKPSAPHVGHAGGHQKKE